jgi:cation transport ATPase
MSLNLTEIGQTLSIGGLVLFGIWSLVRMNGGKINFDFFPERQSFVFMLTSVLLAMIFAIGILFEDVSKNIVAERPIMFEYGALNYILPEDKYMRIVCLSNNKVQDFRSERVTFKPKSLFFELKPKCNKDLDIENKKNIKGEYVLHKNEFDRIVGSFNNLYYKSKNVVYREDNYFNELIKIEHRLNFIRSFTFLSFCFVIVSILNVLIFFIKRIHATFTSRVIFLCLFVLLMFLGRIAFISEHVNYNLRIYGYVLSLEESQIEKQNNN